MAFEEQERVDGWTRYLNWIDNIRSNNELITKYDTSPEFKQKLLSCRTNQERFELLWDDRELCYEIRQYYREDLDKINTRLKSRIGKSHEESSRMRESGNYSFRKNEYMKALNQYTQAVRFAPYPNEKEPNCNLAYALANRSAALYSLTRYRLCLLDIDLAIKYGYPEQNIFKLLIRKVKCLHILSVWANDVEQIKDNLRNMCKRRDTVEWIKIEIMNMFEFIEHTQPEEMEKDELDVVDETTMKISNASKSLTQAGDCVEMSHDSEKGRYLITNKDVSFGRLLLAEEPFVCNLAPNNRDDYCYNCFGRLHSCGLGCKGCTEVLYCSEQCREAKFDTHKYECERFIKFQDEIGVAYVISHILFKINFDLNHIPVYTKKTCDKKSLEDALKISPSDWPDLVYKNDYSAVLSLMDHTNDYSYDELMGYTLTVVYLMIALLDHFPDKLPNSEDKQAQSVIGSIILRHLLQLQTNLISILDQNLQELASVGQSMTEMQEQPIGVGIYPTISLLNHSCSPNILSIFHRNKFIARAARGLECGTEINYCYGPSVNRMSKKDRQLRLKEQYFFTCECDSCKKNNENENRALLCPYLSCQGPVIYNLDLTHRCLRCEKEDTFDVSLSLKKIEGIKLQLIRLPTAPMQKLEKLKDLESSLKELAFWRNPLFVQIKNKLIECAEELEDTDLALKFCEEELELINKTHGKDSYESIMTKLKHLNLMWQSLYYRIDSTESSSRDEPIAELKLLLVSINETRSKLKDLLASTNILGAESSFETELKFLTDLQSSINDYLTNLETSDTVQESEN